MRRRLLLPALLLALTLVATACNATSGQVEITAPTATVATNDVDEIPTATPEPEPEPTATPEPAPQPAQPEPTEPAVVEPEPSYTSPVPGQSISLNLDVDQAACVVTTAFDNVGVVNAFLDDDRSFDELPVADQVVGTEAIFQCAPEMLVETLAEAVNRGFSDTTTMLPYFLARCLERELSPSNPQSTDLITGWTYLRSGGVVPVDYHDVLVFTMTICVPDEVLGELVLGELGITSSAFMETVDDSCLEDTLDGADLKAFWTAYVERTSIAEPLDQATVRTLVGKSLECASLGLMIADGAMGEGVTLSTPTIECFDQGLEGLDVIPSFLDGFEDIELRDQVLAIIESCLTPAELEAAGG